MDNKEQLWELEDCPACGSGAGLMEHEGGWCCYVECLDCGAHTAHFAYNNDEEKAEAERKASYTWNIGKVVRMNPGE